MTDGPHEPQGLYDDRLWVSVEYLQTVVATQIEDESLIGLADRDKQLVGRVAEIVTEHAERLL